MTSFEIDADRLSAWALSYASSGEFPILIRDLIRATVGKEAKLDWPSGKGTYYDGFDGTVTLTSEGAETDSHVPSGISVWELSTREDATAKASEDFKKRSEAEGDIDKKESTYVAVTLRRVKKSLRDNWIADKKSQEIWKDVRFIDAEQISEWLAQYPVIKYQLGQKLGFTSQGISLTEWWKNWNAECTVHAIGGLWALAGREAEATKLLNDLRQGSKNIFFADLGRYDALAFVYSVIIAAPKDESETWLSRSLIISDPSAFRAIGKIVRKAILIPLFTIDEGARGDVDESNTVIFCESLRHRDALELPRITSSKLLHQMEADGVPFELAVSAAKAARNGILFLRAALGARLPVLSLEQIGSQDYATLSALLLAGRWETSNLNDMQLISELAGKQLEDVEATIALLSNGENPLIRKAGTVSFLVDTSLAWRSLARHLIGSVLGRFGSLAPAILGEIDPSFEMPEEERWTAGLTGQTPRYSNFLKNGLSRTLATLALEVGIFGKFSSGQLFADSVIRACFDNLDDQRWFSLSPFLPLLAEASPIQVLSSLEASLESGDGTLLTLFKKDTNMFFSGSRDCYVLWSLERLAWSRLYLYRAVAILASFLEQGIAANSGNSPLSSLTRIFLPWRPCTEATVEERIAVLEALQQSHPDASWKLMVTLLPQHHSVSMNTSQPEFREWSDSTRKATAFEFDTFSNWAVTAVIDQAHDDPLRLAALAKIFAGYPPEWLNRLLTHLDSKTVNMTSDAKTTIWKSMKETYADHRRFPDADWAMKTDTAEKYRQSMDLLEPKDPIDVHLTLFRPWVNLPEFAFDMEGRDEAISAARRNALVQILNYGGLPAVISLASQAEAPGIVGQIADQLGFWEETEELPFLQDYLESEVEYKRVLANGFATSRATRKGSGWLEEKLNVTTWTDVQRASLLLLLPIELASWKRVERETLDVQTIYWQRLNIWASNATSQEELEVLTGNALIHGRARDLLNWLSGNTYSGSSPHQEMAMAITLSALIENPTDRRLSSEDVSHVLRVLSDSRAVNQDLVAQLEFSYMPLVRFSYQPRALARQMADPKSFIRLLSLAFPGEDSLAQLTSHDRRLAQTAYEVLDACKILPGTTEAGIDEEVLITWLKAVREIAIEEDRLEEADCIIGGWLGKTLSNGEIWPPIAICKAIETAGSNVLDENVQTSRENERGVTTRGLDDGGDQERELEQQFRAFAHQRIAYPRVAKILNNIAEHYSIEAHRHDSHAAMQQDL